MNKYLLTYEDAVKIAERYNNNNFRQFQYTINGYKLVAFDYFICGWNDFENPLPDQPEVDAFDMRGTTFVFNKDGSLYKRFFMLPKFFNINQVEATQYYKLMNKEIVNITAKEDGSLIAFMQLPNKKLFTKTIGSFVSDQAQSAYNFLYNWEEKVEWVKMVINAGYTPLFQYVSGPNRIVLKYSKEDLRFLGVRDNFTGEWIPSTELAGQKDIPFTLPKSEEIVPLKHLMERAKIEEDSEGWVVKFKDIMIKIKTAWYFKLHGLRTENVFREDYVIKNYIDQTLDDLMSQLDPIEDEDAFAFVDRVTGALDKYIDHIDNSVRALRDELLGKYEGSWGKFASNECKRSYFQFVKFFIQGETQNDWSEYHRRKIDWILEKTYRLKRAKELVDRFADDKD